MKLPSLLSLCFGLIASVAIDAQISTPSVGYVRYASNEVRGIYGLEGNYVVGGSALASAGAVSFSDDGGLLLQSGSLSLVDSNLTGLATIKVDGLGAIIRMDGNAQTAIAWLPASRTLVHWNGESFVKTGISALPLESEVISVRKLDGNTASLLVSRTDNTVVHYLISLRTGELKNSNPIPGASGFAFEDGTRVLCFNDRKLSVVSETGETLQVFPLPVDDCLLIEQTSSRCLHLSTKTPGQDWLLHLDANDLHLYRLPGPRTSTAGVYGAKPESAK